MASGVPEPISPDETEPTKVVPFVSDAKLPRPDDVVEIRWYAVPNNDTRRGGWMPVYDLNGHQHGDTWGRGFEKDVALKHAEADARAEAAHYCGDWEISVEPRDPVPEPIPAYEGRTVRVDRDARSWAAVLRLRAHQLGVRRVATQMPAGGGRVSETRIAEREPWKAPGEEDRLTERISIPELVEIFRRTEADIRASFASINAGLGRLMVVGLGGATLRLHGRHDSRMAFEWGDPTDVITELRRDVWETLIERMQLRRAMSIAAWKKLKEQIEREEPPEISIENIESMVAQFRDDAPEMLKAAVHEVFNILRPPSSRFKTNTEFEIGERVVLSGYVCAGYGRTWDVEYHYSQELIALENVFRMVDGKVGREDGNHYSDLQVAVEAVPISQPCRGQTEYFEFKGYRKRSLHLRFKRLDLVAKLNAIAGGNRLKPAAQDD